MHYSYQRPLPPFKELKRRFSTALETARARQDLQDVEIPVTPKFHLSFARASETHPQLFLPGLHDDHDSGGFVVSEMAKNLQICIAEKNLKVSRYRSRHVEWWLGLEDRISYGVLDESDRSLLRQLIQSGQGWSKIILVNPLNPSIGFEL